MGGVGDPEARAGVAEAELRRLDATRVLVGGRPLQDEEFEDQVGADLARAELLTGDAAALADYQATIRDRLPLAAALVVLATFVLLFLFTGSVVVPAKAIVMNVLSLGASFGALVWVFQDGNLAWLLGAETTGFLDPTVPVLAFAIAFGLSIQASSR